jgi:hypothetical protein
MRVFITSATYAGNLGGVAGGVFDGTSGWVIWRKLSGLSAAGRGR